VTGYGAEMGSLLSPRRSRWVIVGAGAVAIVLAAAVTISRLPVEDGRRGGVGPPQPTPTSSSSAGQR